MAQIINKSRSYYKRIGNTSRDIRVLTLLPGMWDDTVRCLLRVVSLDALPEYEALSYAWGIETNKKRIFVEDCAVDIFSNLEEALRYLRKERDQLLLWADAICIDQENTEEKTHQVELMGEIYRNCSGVFIWLGVPNRFRTREQAMGSLRQVHHVLRRPKIGKQSTLPRSFLSRRLEGVEGDHIDTDPYAFVHHFAANKHLFDLPGHRSSRRKEQNTVFSANPAFSAMWDGFVDVMQSPWWTRFWVVQECLLPPKATVVFGHWRIPWDTLKVAEQNHRQHILTCCSAAWKAFPKRYAFYPDRLISDTRTAADRGKGAFYDLDRALRAYRHRDCQNPRDKVFGILGLVDRSKYPQLRPDYSLSVRDVYVQAMEAILGEGEGSLRCLTGSGFNSQQQQQQQRMLPSWVRDLAACPDHEILFHEMARLEAYPLYNASAADAPPVKPRFSEDGGLCVKGRVVDEIEKVGPAILHRELKHMMLVLGDWHRAAGLKVLRSPAALEDDRKQQAFWRTVVGDVVPDGDERGWRRLAPHDWKDYGRWLFSMKKARTKALFGWKTEPPFEARFVKAMLSAVYGRALFVTRKGRIGLCYPETRVGDEVWVLHGGRVSFVLRPADDAGGDTMPNSSYTFVGDSYLDGSMDCGEMRSYSELQEVKLK